MRPKRGAWASAADSERQANSLEGAPINSAPHAAPAPPSLAAKQGYLLRCCPHRGLRLVARQPTTRGRRQSPPPQLPPASPAASTSPCPTAPQASFGRNGLAVSSVMTYIGLGLSLLGSSLAWSFGIYLLICQREAER